MSVLVRDFAPHLTEHSWRDFHLRFDAIDQDELDEQVIGWADEMGLTPDSPLDDGEQQEFAWFLARRFDIDGRIAADDDDEDDE